MDGHDKSRIKSGEGMMRRDDWDAVAWGESLKSFVSCKNETVRSIRYGDVFELSVLAVGQRLFPTRILRRHARSADRYENPPVTMGLGWQHWFSPQIEIRPEFTYYRALDAPAFNGNFNATPVIPPNKKDALIAAADLIFHF
jgi:hypothetical protein